MTERAHLDVRQQLRIFWQHVIRGDADVGGHWILGVQPRLLEQRLEVDIVEGQWLAESLAACMVRGHTQHDASRRCTSMPLDVHRSAHTLVARCVCTATFP